MLPIMSPSLIFEGPFDGTSEQGSDFWRGQQEQPMTAISSPNYRWRVGEVEITRVLEFEAA